MFGGRSTHIAVEWHADIESIYMAAVVSKWKSLDGGTVTDKWLNGLVVSMLTQNVRSIGFDSYQMLSFSVIWVWDVPKNIKIIIIYIVVFWVIIISHFVEGKVKHHVVPQTFTNMV